MKIAIYHNLPSGGGKRALFEMTRRLANHHKIDVYTLSTSDLDFCDLRPFSLQHSVFAFRPLPLARSPFGRINQAIRIIDLLRLERVQQRIAERIEQEDYDVAFVHNCQFSQSPGLLKFLRKPSVYYCAEPPRQIYEPPISRPYLGASRIKSIMNRVDPLPGLYRRTLAHMDRKNVRSAQKVLVNSYYSRETLYRTYGIFSHVGWLGVDTERFRPINIPKGDFVLSVGALHPRKGFDFIIKSLALIRANRRPRLVLVSNFVNPPERAFIETLARDLSVALDIRVRISDDELISLYNQALLTVYAPIMEPFGFVPLESMACGTPVVGVAEGGVRETIRHNVTGLLVERDPKRFAEVIQQLLEDELLRQHLAENCRDYVVREWTWERSSQVLEHYLYDAARAAP